MHLNVVFFFKKIDVLILLKPKSLFSLDQGSHRLQKHLNLQDCLEKSLKIIFALKSTRKTTKGLEKSLNFTIQGVLNTFFGDLNQHKIVVSLFGAAYAAPIKAPQFYKYFLKLIF